MSDLLWLQIVEGFLETEAAGGDLEALRGKLLASDGAKLAYTQWICGASDRVVRMLLRRALMDIEGS